MDCKSMYASIQPDRDTYGNNMYAVANMDASDIKYLRIGKIIPSDLSFVASNYIEFLSPGPASNDTITLSPSLHADGLDCIQCTREQEWKRKEVL